LSPRVIAGQTTPSFSFRHNILLGIFPPRIFVTGPAVFPFFSDLPRTTPPPFIYAPLCPPGATSRRPSSSFSSPQASWRAIVSLSFAPACPHMSEVHCRVRMSSNWRNREPLSPLLIAAFVLFSQLFPGFFRLALCPHRRCSPSRPTPFLSQRFWYSSGDLWFFWSSNPR